MSSLMSFVAGVVALFPLALAGAVHLVSPRATMATLRKQRLLPNPVIPVIYLGLVTAELSIGVGGLVAIAVAAPAWATATALHAGTVAYVLFTLYVAALLRWRPQAPCGCSMRGRAATRWTLTRSALLACLAGAAITVGGPSTTWISGPLQLTIGLATVTTFAIIVWVFPDTVPDHQPGLVTP
jgi:hypothetical protein